MYCAKCHYGSETASFLVCPHCGHTAQTDQNPFPESPKLMGSGQPNGKTARRRGKLRGFGAVAAVMAALAIAVAGCASPTTERYPWNGPLVDPDGHPAPEPSYETIQK